ncbi:MAG: hypothetical protein R8N50_01610 [Alphaproteobacteria bacterium]|nr:hypothetical protein [Alphaproteobacteria bacterium]
MRKFFALFVVLGLMTVSGGVRADGLLTDTSDPMFLQAEDEILSQTSISYWDHVLRAGQSVSYGLKSRLALGANVFYQNDFDGEEDGFAAIDVGGTYRMSGADDNDSNIISDVLFGFKFGGSHRVRTPDYADSTYYVGLRMGRQWAGMTLAATVKSTWVFDDERGVAFLDFTPEAYFRTVSDWRFGLGLTVRKATNQDPVYHTNYNQEWLHFKVVRQYGRTQYIGHLDYEFESDDAQVGARINILF